MKTAEQNKCGPVVREGGPVSSSRLWWKRFVERWFFEFEFSL